jgi:hypothetical protein
VEDYLVLETEEVYLVVEVEEEKAYLVMEVKIDYLVVDYSEVLAAEVKIYSYRAPKKQTANGNIYTTYTKDFG